MAPARAEEEFLAGYETARDLVSAFFLAQRMSSSAQQGRGPDRLIEPEQ
jgi:hypothetical protein